MCIGYIDLKRSYMGELSSDFDNKSKFKVTWKILKQATPPHFKLMLLVTSAPGKIALVNLS